MTTESELKIENEKLKKRIKELELAINKSPVTRPIKSKFRGLDFSKYRMRHIALKFCYLGWSYCGLAKQRIEDNTVVERIIDALETCKLIEKREDSNIVVCGRTDKGVSAFQQVISLNVRSKLNSAIGIIEGSGININQRKDNCDEEIDYVFLLNKVLPNDIRILAWSPVGLDFNARFNCKSRSYKYFFTKSDLCIESMKEASKKLIGEHDFRNFCSMQINQGIVYFVRTILDVTIEPYDQFEQDTRYRMYVVHITGSSFLYHQIRCIVAVLLMIGQKKENIDIIDHLLDINGAGGLGKPMYIMASELPLVFYDACYDEIDWRTSSEALNDYVYTMQKMWVQHETKQSILKLFLDEINLKNSSELKQQSLLSAIVNDLKSVNYKPLLKRHKESTLEEKIATHNNKLAKKSVD